MLHCVYWLLAEAETDAEGWDTWLNANPLLQDSLGNVGGQTWSPHLEEPQVDNSDTVSRLLSAPLSLGTVMDTLHSLYLISFKGRWRTWGLSSTVSNSASMLKGAKVLKSITRPIVKAEGWHCVFYIFSLSLSIAFSSVDCIYISVQHVWTPSLSPAEVVCPLLDMKNGIRMRDVQIT